MKNIILLFLLLLFLSTADAASYITVTNTESHAASYNSRTINVIPGKKSAVHIVWVETVATLAGTVYLQSSIDNSNWENITGAVATVSGSGSMLFNVESTGYNYLRTAYTRTTGTGTFYTIASIK